MVFNNTYTVTAPLLGGYHPLAMVSKGLATPQQVSQGNHTSRHLENRLKSSASFMTIPLTSAAISGGADPR